MCNVDVVISEASKMGFAVELDVSSGSFLDKFGQANRAVFHQLTNEDKAYVSMYRVVTLRLVKSRNRK